MGKINISMGNELYRDIEQIFHHRLLSQPLSNVKKKIFYQKKNNKNNLYEFSYLF